MAHEQTLGVLSPLIAGFYYGGILSGIQQAVRERGRRLVAIQTLNEYSYFSYSTYSYPFAWDQIEAWILVQRATSDVYAQQLARSGNPVVTVSDSVPGIDCPVVLPDNRHGMAEAVRHLIQHGHQRIAFIGNLEQQDLRERYEGYLSALAEAGVAPDPNLFFETTDNLEYGSRAAAERMLAAGLPCTAAVAATDLNAVGVMALLEEAGYSIPSDFAIIGFDNLKEADYTRPALTSVHQDFSLLGYKAVEIILEMLSGQSYPAGPVYVPTALVPRRTCGCTATISINSGATPATQSEQPAEPRSMPGSPSQPAERLDHMSVEGLRSRLLSEVERNNHLQHIVERYYNISMGLLGSTSSTAVRYLSWLDHTYARRGCLALWCEDEHDQLEVVDTYNRSEATVPSIGARLTPQQFPPPDMLSTQNDENVVSIFPLKTREREWGVLLLDAPIDLWVSRGLGQLSQVAGLLSAALEREELTRSLAMQQETLREAYERERVLADTVRELSCPIIPLLRGTILVPIIGAVDSRRANQLLEEVLHAVSSNSAHTVLLDITGVPLIDTQVANSLIHTARATKLLGADVIIVGVRPEIAQSIVALGIDMSGIGVHQTLASALEELQRQPNGNGNALRSLEFTHKASH